MYNQALKPFLFKKYKSEIIAQNAFDMFLKDILTCSNYNELLFTMSKHDIYIMPWIVAAQPNPLSRVVGGEMVNRDEINTQLVRKTSFDGSERLQLYSQGINILSAVEIPPTSMAIQTLRMIHQFKPKNVVIWGHSGGANALNSMLKIIQEGWADDLLEHTKINGAIMFGRISIPDEIYKPILTLLALVQNPDIAKKAIDLMHLNNDKSISQDVQSLIKYLSTIEVRDFVSGINPSKLDQKISGPVIDVKNQFDPEQPSREMFVSTVKFLYENAIKITDSLVAEINDNTELKAYLQNIGVEVENVTKWTKDQTHELIKKLYDSLIKKINDSIFFPYPQTLEIKITNEDDAILWKKTQSEMYNLKLSGAESDTWNNLILNAHINISPQLSASVLK